MELIGAPRAWLPDDVIHNLPLYLTSGVQAFRKYFSPKWKDFAVRGEMENMMEASLASVVQAMGILAIEGLQVAVESMQTTYEQLQVDLKESNANVLALTKKLDHANVAQRKLTEALEVANEQKKKLKEECDSYELEVTCLRKEAKVLKTEVDGLEESLGASKMGRKELEAKLENVEAEFVANFHNNDAYTNFSYFFVKVGHQEVLAIFQSEHLELDISSLEAKFPLADVVGEEGG
ncbi:putative abhydrolase domain-containing protein [Abeliophyllum distichum]|uniref:Abhydrolase domain-containing protein n=1 Tax=Abeliophyllum distichum TaxID=126358 RepID=A0ABD1PTM8_9LAMI